MQHAVRVEEEVENKVLVLFNAFVPFYRPKEEDGKEDLGLHAYACLLYTSPSPRD